MRILAIALTVVLASGCERQGVSAPAPDDPPAPTPVEPDPYAAYELPAVTDDWGPREYAKVRDVLVEIEREQPELLLTLAGPKGDVLARVAKLDALADLLATTPDMEAMFEVSEAVGAIYKLYANRVLQQQHYGPEYLLLAAATVRSASTQFARLTAVIDEATLRTDAIRRDGLLQMRHGVVTIYGGALEAPLKLPAVVDASDAVAKLEVVAAEVAPFLLPDEREVVERLLTALADAGADAARIAATRAAIAATPMHPLIAAFGDEARAYSDKQRQLLADVAEQQQLAVEIGPELGGVRYAFPEAGFSAVFHQRPNAMLTTATATDGVLITTRVLGTRDATGYTTAIVCMSRPSPLASDDGRGFARKTIEGIDATEVRELEIGGRRAFEGAISTSISRGFMQAVELERGGCTIVAEYPPALAASYEQQARAFLDSVALGEFNG